MCELCDHGTVAWLLYGQPVGCLGLGRSRPQHSTIGVMIGHTRTRASEQLDYWNDERQPKWRLLVGSNPTD